MHPMLNVAIQAIRKAGNFIVKQYEFLDHNHIKLSPNYMEDFISNIHKESNRIIKTIIKKFYPLHVIDTHTTYSISNKKYKNNNVYWIIESIDNNANFIKQFPFFALSIAAQCNEHIQIGVIYDPIHNELFSACRGTGAQLNGYRIKLNYPISQNLNKAIFTISCPHLIYYTNPNILNKLHKQYSNINFRLTGSTILDLAYVASGRVDGCFINSSKTINKLASGALIVKEAGGLITDFYGNSIHEYYQFSGNIIAGHSKTIKTVLSLFKKYI